MKKISLEELIGLYHSNEKNRYKKVVSMLYRFASEGETILTIVNGKLETIKKAGNDEVVLKNLEIGGSAEEYIIKGESFRKRYIKSNEEESFIINNVTWEKAEAIGEIFAFKYEGETIKFDAPWGEEMLCENGDYIAHPVDGNDTDYYRIEKEAFNCTYKEI